jgi:hypothetical protein
MGDNVVVYSFLFVYHHTKNWNNVMMKPFEIVWELLVFGLQALFLWVLAIIICVGIIAGVIYDQKQQEPKVEYIYEQVEIIKEIEKTLEEKNLICTRIQGCETFENAKTPEEYCPTCEYK